jgi:hypothetical protein
VCTARELEEPGLRSLPSPFAGKISHDCDRGTASGDDYGAHYIDWFAPGTIVPKVLVESDLPKLRGSQALFARKFDEVRSQRLLKLLEEELPLS